MSNHARAIVFYGVCFEDESADAAKFRIGKRDPEKTETAPHALHYWGHPQEGVECVKFGHYNEPRFALAIAGSVEKGPLWGAMPLEELLVSPKCGDDDVLKAYCDKHGLTWSEPRWWIVPYYG